MCATTIDDFPLSSKKFLRYGLWKPLAGPCQGSVIILSDYGNRLEDVASLAMQLNQRGFHVANFEWIPYSLPQDHSTGVYPALTDDFRAPLKNVQQIFSSTFLIHMPAPFYVFGIGMGAVFGLAAHHILQTQVRRMVLVSPLFAPYGHQAGGLFHRYARFMADLGLGGWRTNQPIADKIAQLDPITMARQARAGHRQNLYPTLGSYQALLDAAQWVLSSEFREKISIPLLCMLSSSDSLSEARLARQFCDSLRCAAAITLRHAKRLPFEGDTHHARQFWRAVDAFIPGTGAPDPDRSLEDGLVL